jgi:hypothetical protein
MKITLADRENPEHRRIIDIAGRMLSQINTFEDKKHEVLSAIITAVMYLIVSESKDYETANRIWGELCKDVPELMRKNWDIVHGGAENMKKETLN